MHKTLRVTLVNTHDSIGGAERCSYELARGLVESGHDVSLIVGYQFSNAPFVVRMNYRPFDSRLRSFAYARFGLTDTTIGAPLYECWRMDALRRADVYNLHNMHGAFWNFWTVPILARRSPVVVSLHDEWLLTGDCAFSYDCARWQRSCGRCPQALKADPTDRVCIGGGDATWLNVKLKRAMFRCVPRGQVVLVSPSRWLADRAAETPHLAPLRHFVIPYGVDLNVFRPSNPGDMQRGVDLPQNRFVVLMFAANLFDRRKNLQLVLDASRSDRWPRDALLVVAGRTTEALERELRANPRCRLLGYIWERAELARWLAASDLVVVPSRADNLPFAALEAQACGTPVLGARVGGIPEALRENESGWLFDPNCSPEDLAARVAEIRAIPESRMRDFRLRAREHAVERFALDRFLEAYSALFKEMAASHVGSASPFVSPGSAPDLRLPPTVL